MEKQQHSAQTKEIFYIVVHAVW